MVKEEISQLAQTYCTFLSEAKAKVASQRTPYKSSYNKMRKLNEERRDLVGDASVITIED